MDSQKGNNNFSLTNINIIENCDQLNRKVKAASGRNSTNYNKTDKDTLISSGIKIIVNIRNTSQKDENS